MLPGSAGQEGPTKEGSHTQHQVSSTSTNRHARGSSPSFPQQQHPPRPHHAATIRERHRQLQALRNSRNGSSHHVLTVLPISRPPDQTCWHVSSAPTPARRRSSARRRPWKLIPQEHPNLGCPSAAAERGRGDRTVHHMQSRSPPFPPAPGLCVSRRAIPGLPCPDLGRLRTPRVQECRLWW